jgi:hypothetical protein
MEVTPQEDDENIKQLDRLVANLATSIDLAKHTMTFAAGTIVLIATFLDKISPVRCVKAALPTAIVALLISIVFAFAYCFAALKMQLLINSFIIAIKHRRAANRAADMAAADRKLKKQTTYTDALLPIFILSFVVGIVSLGVFVIGNLK